jgi:hypothetical protein
MEVVKVLLIFLALFATYAVGFLHGMHYRKKVIYKSNHTTKSTVDEKLEENFAKFNKAAEEFNKAVRETFSGCEKGMKNISKAMQSFADTVEEFTEVEKGEH